MGSQPKPQTLLSGILGLAIYAVASGFPLLILCLCGDKVLKLHPDVVSVGDFSGKRFGPTVKLVVVLIVLFNMVRTPLSLIEASCEPNIESQSTRGAAAEGYPPSVVG